ncbi:MAG: cyclophilin-like fold protein [Promethearchaeota archaeon]
MSDKGDISIRIEIFGVGNVEGVIIRHLGPISADAILSKLPFVLRGRFAIGSKNYWTLPIGIKKGPDSKATKNVEKGDIIYNPKTDEMIILLETIEMPNKVNKIGRITANIELFHKATNGMNTKISLLK